MRKKLVIFLSNMHGGGSQRVISILLNYINKKEYEITLVLINKTGIFLNEIPNDIKIIDLNAKKARYAIIKINYIIIKEKPDIILSTLGYMNLIVILTKYLFGRKHRYIARESNIPSIKNKRLKPSFLYNLLYRILYKKYDYIICQSEDMKKDLIENYSIEADKLIIINNPVDFNLINKQPDDKITWMNCKRRKRIIAIGKLTEQKGFDFLLEAFAMIQSMNSRLYILGTGEKEIELKNLCRTLGISDRVEFMGFKENPFMYLKKADVFVLSSRYEGFPNVVLEAMACGKQVVAFNCPGGLNEIITNGKNGWLVESGNIIELARTIEYALSHPLDPEIIRQSIWQRYRVDLIIKKYEKLFNMPVNR